MAVSNVVFSEYELRELAFAFNDAEGEPNFTHADCVGQWEEEAETLQVTKNCRGKVQKRRTMGTGSGTVTYTGHMPQDIFTKMFDMQADGLVDGVTAYGADSRHKEMTVVAKVLDEDGNVKYKAYPCMVANTLSRSVENGAEEVAEVEIEFSWMQDSYGFGLYEVLEKDLGEDTAGLKTKWMTAWTPDLMQASA